VRVPIVAGPVALLALFPLLVAGLPSMGFHVGPEEVASSTTPAFKVHTTSVGELFDYCVSVNLGELAPPWRVFARLVVRETESPWNVLARILFHRDRSNDVRVVRIHGHENTDGWSTFRFSLPRRDLKSSTFIISATCGSGRRKASLVWYFDLAEFAHQAVWEPHSAVG
jgi:hypothetical protein